MDSYVTRGEHTEFVKRMEDEHHRQNKRLGEMEATMKQYVALTLSVEKMAISMEAMLEEQKKQGQKLEELEKTPAKNWNTVKTAVLSAIGGAIGAALIAVIVFGLINQL